MSVGYHDRAQDKSTFFSEGGPQSDAYTSSVNENYDKQNCLLQWDMKLTDDASLLPCSE